MVKLLDFGIAKLLEHPTGGYRPHAAGPALTPDSPPGAASGGRCTTATDVYALGVLLIVLLAGRHPTALPPATQVERLRALVEANRGPW